VKHDGILSLLQEVYLVERHRVLRTLKKVTEFGQDRRKNRNSLLVPFRKERAGYKNPNPFLREKAAKLLTETS
jgi:hypothetical protein